jgi:hypothetical protein
MCKISQRTPSAHRQRRQLLSQIGGGSEEIAEWYGEEYLKNFDAVSRLSREQLIKIVDFRGLFQRPAYTFLQAGLLHAVHHRGQLSTYLRPMGGKVPAIYGESYDSAEAKKAAQTVA